MQIPRIVEGVIKWELYISRGLTHVGNPLSIINNALALVTLVKLFWPRMTLLEITLLLLAFSAALLLFLTILGYIDVRFGWFKLATRLSNEHNEALQQAAGRKK